jgi:hypothetical protein
MSWAARAAANILPLSAEPKNLAVALARVGIYRDVRRGEGDDRPSRELCGHPDLRYQFEIKNRLNGNRLRVDPSASGDLRSVYSTNTGPSYRQRKRAGRFPRIDGSSSPRLVRDHSMPVIVFGALSAR